MPLGKASIARPGTDLTIVTWGAIVYKALNAAKALEREGVSVEVVDVRSILPFDTETVLASARKTGRVLVAYEDHEFMGFGAEIAAQISDGAFGSLDAPVKRVAGAFSSDPLCGRAGEGRAAPGRRRARRGPRGAGVLTWPPVGRRTPRGASSRDLTPVETPRRGVSTTPDSMRLFFFVLAFLLTPGVGAQGRLAFDTLDHEMGRLTEVEPGRHTFSFTNEGDAPAELVEVESTCGCTVPAFTPGAVAPGGTGEVSVVYDTRGRPGPFEKAVHVVTDAGQAVTLRISGVVEPALVASGEAIGHLTFETLVKEVEDLGGPVQTSIQFANAGTRPIRVERVVTSTSGVDVVFPQGPVFPDHLGGLFVTVEDPERLVWDGDAAVVGLSMHTTDTDEPVKHLAIQVRRARAEPRDG